MKHDERDLRETQMVSTPSRRLVPWMTNQQLEYAAAALAYLVAVLHLFHPKLGFQRLVLLLSVNPEVLLSDPRPIAFVLSGIAIIIGMPLVLLGLPKRVLYVIGVFLMVTYITGYFAWHLSGHGGFLPGREPLYHGLAPHEAVIVHLSSDLWATLSIIAETILLIVLGALYYREC